MMDLAPAYRELFLGYVELFRRRLAVYAMTNGFYGSELPEAQLREVVNVLTERLRVECGLSDEQHAALKGELVKMIFGARKRQWLVKGKGN